MPRIRLLLAASTLVALPFAGACSGAVDCDKLGNRIQDLRDAGNYDEEAKVSAEYRAECVEAPIGEVQLDLP